MVTLEFLRMFTLAFRFRGRTGHVSVRRSSSRAGGFVGVAAGLALGLVAASCGGSSTKSAPPGPTPLRVAFVPATTVLPLQVAAAEGFFAKNNLKVTLTEASNISNLPAALGHQFDISLGTATDLINAGAADLDVVEVAGNTISTKVDPFVKLIVRPSSGITNISDLRGKTVGSPTVSGVINVAVEYWAKQKGVDPSTIRQVQVPTPNLPDQLKAGRIDAAEALEPVATQLLKAGDVSLGDPFSHVAEPLATNFWIAQGAWARAHRVVVARFVNSLKEAQAYITSHPTQARTVLQGYTNLPAPVASTVPLPTYDFNIRTGDLNIWVKALKFLGQLNGHVDTKKLVLMPAK